MSRAPKTDAGMAARLESSLSLFVDWQDAIVGAVEAGDLDRARDVYYRAEGYGQHLRDTLRAAGPSMRYPRAWTMLSAIEAILMGGVYALQLLEAREASRPRRKGGAK